jgi:molybdenum cofactor synthesis domain-containing protein
MKWDEIKIAILVISDRSYRGEREDATGPALERAVGELGGKVEELGIVPDEVEEIARELRRLCGVTDLVLTAGGTGASPRDVTPEATLKVIERELPGFGETMRSESRKITPHAMISRAISGICGRALVINLPGSPRGAVECLAFVAPAIPHALDLIKGKQVE